MKFDAFISYSQHMDGKLAPALQSGLHRFTKPWYRLRAMRVFRDDTTLALTPALWPRIKRSLDDSACLILMASPKAAESVWVKKEIEHWIGTKPEKPILIVWASGTLVWEPGTDDFDWDKTDCLPSELKGYFREGAPLYLDFKWAREQVQLSLKHPKFLNAIAKLASGITGRDIQDLLGEEVIEHRRTRKMVISTAVMLVLLLAAAAISLKYAIDGQIRATKGEKEVQRHLTHATSLLSQASYSAWNEAERNRSAGKPQEALAYIAKGMENAPGNTGLVTFAYSLLGSEGIPWRTLSMDFPVSKVFFDETGNNLVIAEKIFDDATRYSSWNLQTMRKDKSWDLPADSEIRKKDLASMPWLKGALETKSDSDEERFIAPGGFQELVHGRKNLDEGSSDETDSDHHSEAAADELRVTSGQGLGGYLGAVVEFTLTSDRYFGGAQWNQNGTRVATIHGVQIDGEIQKGKVLVWDLRHADGLNFLPTDSGTVDEAEDDYLSEHGDYVHRLNDDGTGTEIAIKGQPNPLWKIDELKDHETKVLFDPDRRKILVCHFPHLETVGRAEIRLAWRDIQSGQLVADRTVVAANWEIHTPTELALHPSSSATAILHGNTLITWSSINSPPRALEVPGPKDGMGWANAVTFMPKGDALLLGTGRRMLFLKWPELQLITDPPYHDSLVSHIAVSTDSKLAFSSSGFGDGAGSSGYGQLWKIPELFPIGPRLTHAQQMSGLGFLESGNLLYTASESPDGSDIRLWDAQTLLPLTSYLSSPPGTGQASIRFDSFQSGELSEITMVGEIDSFVNQTFGITIPINPGKTPSWFHQHFLPFVSAKKIAPEGSIKNLSPSEMHYHYIQLQQPLSEKRGGIHHTILKWYFSDFSKRSIDPWNSAPLDLYLENTVFSPTRSGRERSAFAHAYRLDPSHPLLHLHMALKEEDPAIRQRLVEYGLLRLRSPLNRETYGKTRWQTQLITGKDILDTLGIDLGSHETLNALIQKLQNE